MCRLACLKNHCINVGRHLCLLTFTINLTTWSGRVRHPQKISMLIKTLGSISSLWSKNTIFEMSQGGYLRPMAADVVRCGSMPQHCSKYQCRDNLATLNHCTTTGDAEYQRLYIVNGLGRRGLES